MNWSAGFVPSLTAILLLHICMGIRGHLLALSRSDLLASLQKSTSL
jgi:hypothetical protein